MQTQTRTHIATAHSRPRDGLIWGLAAGIVPNAVIAIVVYSTSWVDDHVADWLTVGVLYAGPVVVGLAGLLLISSPLSRRRGVGLVLAALLTVAFWYVYFAVVTGVAVSANTAGG